ncbi:hypothetical protein GKC32_01880 [Lactobacillus curvatus]|nr:hypothetical protein [Latilactobacillus curvatus]MSE23223.1 hypothetical protein [Latilactobacillus curvatus]
MQKTTTAFYQPNYAYFVTIWSWIGFIYILALIVQLELINLNWQSWVIGVIAVCVTLWVIFGYRLSLSATTMTLKRPVFKAKRIINREMTTTIIVQKHGLLIRTNELDYQPEQLLLSRKAKQVLIEHLKQNDWPIEA